MSSWLVLGPRSPDLRSAFGPCMWSLQTRRSELVHGAPPLLLSPLASHSCCVLRRHLLILFSSERSSQLKLPGE